MPLTPEEETQLHAELEARRQRIASMAAAVTPEQGAAAAQLAANYPWLRGTAVYVAATNNLSADHPVSQQLAELAAQWETDRGTRWRQQGEQVQASELAQPADSGFLADFVAGVKTAARGAFTAFHGGLHELVTRPLQAAWMSNLGAAEGDDTLFGVFPLRGQTGQTFGEAYTDIGPSPLVRATQEFAANPAETLRMWRGSEEYLGTGVFPGGRLTREYEADIPVIGTNERTGMPVTSSPGRLIAWSFTEPGTKPFSVLSGLTDATVSLKFDPASGVLKRLSGLAAAHRTFSEFGLITGVRKSTSPKRAAEWFNRRPAQRLRQWIADHDDYDTVRTVLNLTDRRLARRLQQARTVTEVDAILVPELGVSNALRNKPPTGRIALSLQTRKRIHDVRLFNDVPSRVVAADNLDDALANIDRWMINSKIPAQRRTVYNEMVADIADDDPMAATKLRSVVDEVMSDSEGILIGNGVKPADARRITQLSRDFDEAVRAYWVDATTGGHADFPGVQWKTMIDGTPIEPMATPHDVTEYLQRYIHLPDHRMVRRKAAFYARTLDIPGVRQGRHMLDIGLEAAEKGQGVWKVAQLGLRLAYTTRIMSEAQVRMAAAGLVSFADHPFQMVAWLVANSEDKARKLAEGFALSDPARAAKYAARAERLGKVARGSTAGEEVLGFQDEFMEALNRASAGWHRDRPRIPNTVFTNDHVPHKHPRVGGDDANFVRAAAEQMLGRSNSPVSARVANGGLFDGDKAPGARPGLDGVKEWYWSGAGRKFRIQMAEAEGGRRSALLHDRAFADATIDSFNRRIDQLTGGNPNLRQGIAVGNLDGVPLRGLEPRGRARVAKVLTADYMDVLPDYVSGSRTVKIANGDGRWDRGLEILFHYLNSKPDNYLNRSVTFRQYNWKRQEELIPWATPDVQTEIIDAARKANLGDDTISRMQAAARKGAGDRLTSYDDVKILAKTWALSETKNLLYDVHRRGQFFDMTRIIFPFGDAFKEVITTWAKLAARNPQIVRRGQQAITGARGMLTYPDETTGQEFFVYPMPGVSSWLLGGGQADVSFVGRVEGLNLVSGSIIPGVGPAVQLGAGLLVPDTPDWDWARENVLYPFGEPDTSEGVVEGLAPAWIRKVRVALAESPDTQRQYASIVGNVMRALQANGTHSTQTPEELTRLVEDAKRIGKRLLIIQGVTQMAVPTGPSLRFTTEDVEGRVWPTLLLGHAYRDLLEAHDGDEVLAVKDFIAYFGAEDVPWIQGQSIEVKKRAVTPSGVRWERRHPQQVRDFPDVVGYFAPYAPTEQLDFAAYRRQFEQGARVALTPEQQARMSNDFLGRVAYENAQRQVAGKKDQASTQWLRDVKAHLRHKYPGYDTIRDTIPGRLPRDAMIAELERAAADPVLANTDAGKGLALYLAKRREAMAAAHAIVVNGKPLAWPTGAASARHLRDWLRTVGPAVVGRHADFGPLWTEVFSRELDETDEAAPAVPASSVTATG